MRHGRYIATDLQRTALLGFYITPAPNLSSVSQLDINPFDLSLLNYQMDSGLYSLRRCVNRHFLY